MIGSEIVPEKAARAEANLAVALARRLKALADPTRIQLVSMMLGLPDHEACTCDLAPTVKLSEPRNFSRANA